MKDAKSILGPWRGGLAALALLAGGVIAWVDSRPGRDDTGVTAGAVFLVAGVNAASGVPAWVAGLAAAGPLLGVSLAAGHAGALLAVVPAAVGAVAGALVRRAAHRAA